MANPKDFTAKQIRTSQLIASGGIGGTSVGMIVYSASISTDMRGGFPATLLDDPGTPEGHHKVGEDVYFFVSGSANSMVKRGSAWSANGDQGVFMVGGDMFVSGNLEWAGASNTSGWTEAATWLHPTTVTKGIGIGSSDDPVSMVKVKLSPNVDTSGNKLREDENYHLVLRNESVTNDRWAGIGFEVDTTANENTTATILARRVGVQGQGNLEFFNKISDAADAVPIQRLSINHTDSISITGSMLDIGWDPNDTFNVDLGPTLRLSSHHRTFSNLDENVGTIEFYIADEQNGKGPGAKIRAASAGVQSFGGHNQPTDIQFWTSNDSAADPIEQRMVITKNGDVGIGIDPPTKPLHIDKVDAEASIQLARQDASINDGDIIAGVYFGGSTDGGTTYDLDSAAIKVEAVGAWDTTDTDSGSRLSFWTTPEDSASTARRMSIQDDGRISIGSNIPIPSAELEIQVDPDSPTTILITADGNSSGSLAFRKENNTGTAAALVLNKDESLTLFNSGSAKEILVKGHLQAGGHESSGDKNFIRMRPRPLTPLATWGSQILFMSGVGESSPSSDDPASASDVNFWVSGSKGSRGGQSRGTAAFAGDVVISGTLYGGSPLEIGSSVHITGSLVEIGWDPNDTAITGGPTLRLASHEAGVFKSDELGTIEFVGYDSSGVVRPQLGAKIVAISTDTWDGGNDAPAALQFWINENGFSPPAPAMVIAEYTQGGFGAGKGVGIGTTAPSGSLDVFGDGETSQIFLLSGSGGKSDYSEKDYKDLAFFVSGSIGSRGTTTKGTAVFGGDLVASGTIYGTIAGGTAAGGWVDDGTLVRLNTITDQVGIGTVSLGSEKLKVSGDVVLDGANVDVAQFIRHIGDTTTNIEFSTSKMIFEAASDNLLQLNGGEGIGINNDSLDRSTTIYTADRMAFGTARIGPTLDGANQSVVLILSGGGDPTEPHSDPQKMTDVGFYVSGSVGSKGSLVRGTALFAGDLQVSGTIYGTLGSPVVAAGGWTDDGSLVRLTTIGDQVGIGTVSLGSEKLKVFGDTVLNGSNLDIGGGVDSAIRMVGSTTTLIKFHTNPHASKEIYLQPGGENMLLVHEGSFSLPPEDLFKVAASCEINTDSLDRDVAIKTADRYAFASVRTTPTLGGQNQSIVLILSGGGKSSPNPVAQTDLGFYVSGSIGSRGTTVRGTSIFGGDLVTSGGLYVSGAIHSAYLPSSKILFEGTEKGNIKFFANDEEIMGIFGEEGGGQWGVEVGQDTVGSDHGQNLKIHANNNSSYFISEGFIVLLSGTNSGPTDPNPATFTDLAFYVSGSIGTRQTSTRGTAVFGGDVVISGSLYGGSPISVGSDMVVSGTLITSGSSYVSGSTTISGSMTVTGSLTVSGSDTFTVFGPTLLNAGGASDSDIRMQTANKTHAFFADTSTDQVLILSGGVNHDPDFNVATWSDTNFFVSGTIGSKGKGRGTSVFGGDLQVSGTIYGTIAGGTSAGGWTDDGSVVKLTTISDQVGIGLPGSGDTAPGAGVKLAVRGGDTVLSGTNLDVANRIRHIGDTDTLIEFTADRISLEAGGVNGFSFNQAESSIALNNDSAEMYTLIKTPDRMAWVSGRFPFGSPTQSAVLILSGGGPTSPSEAGFTDTAFHVSGSIGSRGTSDRGTSVFGGDVVVSGSHQISGSLSLGQYGGQKENNKQSHQENILFRYSIICSDNRYIHQQRRI